MKAIAIILCILFSPVALLGILTELTVRTFKAGYETSDENIGRL